MNEIEKDLVSIIIPVHNAGRFLRDTINSIKNQTYENWEAIFVDDCSRDNSSDIIKEFSEDIRIKLITLEQNGGVAVARNIGIDNAKGKYIAFLDADDLWEKEKLEKQIKVIEKDSNIGLIFTGTRYIDENSNPYNYVLEVPKTINYKELLKQNVISCSSVLVKKEHVIKYKMPNDGMHEDFAVWLQILKEGIKVVGINEPLLVYRISRNSKSSNKFKAAKMNLNVYKFLGLNFMEIIYYMLIYTYKGLTKYKKIKKS